MVSVDVLGWIIIQADMACDVLVREGGGVWKLVRLVRDPTWCVWWGKDVLEHAEWLCGPCCWGFGDLTITPFRVYCLTVLGGGLEAVSTVTMHCRVCCVLTYLHLAGRLLWKVC